MMGKSSKKSAPKVDVAVPSSESAKQGKWKGEDELEKQVSTKKQKRDEVAEKQNNVKEIRSDDSSSYSEQEQKSAKSGTLSTREEKGNPDTSSNSSEYSDDDSDEDKQNAASNAQRYDSKTVEKDTSSDISDDDDDDKDNDDDGDDSYDDSEKPHMVKKPVKGSESSEDSEEEIEEKSSKTPQERGKDVEMVDAASIEKKAPKTPATLKVENATSKKICVRNLSYSVERADMENLFKECGEIVDVHLHTDNKGRFRGYGHVLFATAEAAQKALELDNTELLRRPIKVDISWENDEFNPNSSNLSKTFQTGGSVQFQTKVENATPKKICVRNLSYSVERADMENLFKECGEIVDVRLHKDNNGRFRGFGHVLFATAEAAQRALELDNTELLRRPIKVDISWEKGEHNPNSSNLSKTFQTGGSVQFQTKVENATSKKICVRNLSYSVERADMENLFKECGEIVDVHLHTDSEGRFRGFGHVLFSTAEAAQKALELDNTELLRRPIKVDIAWEKGEYNPNNSNLSKTFQTGGSFQFQTICVAGFNKSLTEEKVKDVEMVDVASIEKKVPKTPATLKVQNATSKKICVRNLSNSVERADMETLFKECGEIVDVHLHTDSEGRFRGFGHVLFATAEAAQKALELDNTELLRRPIKVDIAREEGEYNPNSSNLSKTFQTGGSVQFQTIYVAGFNKSLTEEKIKASLEEHFSSCGEITRISIPKYYSGAVKGFAHLDFKDVDSFEKALQLHRSEIGGYRLSVEKAIPLRGGHQSGGRDGGGWGIQGRCRSGGSWRH